MKSLRDFIEKFVLVWETEFEEGHYGDDRYVRTENVLGDNGGVTRYGIDSRSHPDIDVSKLTKEEAILIYFKEYRGFKWDIIGAHCSALEEFPHPSSFAFFDCMINAGRYEASICAQRALGIMDDSVLGLKSRESIIKAEAKSFSFLMIEERKRFYKVLIKRRPSLQKFYTGWMNRCEALNKFIEKC